MWIREPAVVDVIHDSYSPTFCLTGKTKATKKALKIWSGNVFGNVKVRIEGKRQLIEAVTPIKKIEQLITITPHLPYYYTTQINNRKNRK